MKNEAPDSFDHLLIATSDMNLLWNGPDWGVEEEKIIHYLLSKWKKEIRESFSTSYTEIQDALDFNSKKPDNYHSLNPPSVKKSIDRISKTTISVEKKNGKGKIVSGATMRVLSSYTWDDKSQIFNFILDDDFVRHIAPYMITGLH